MPYPSIRVFKSDFLEWFTHIHPLTPLVCWGPLGAYFLVRSLAPAPWGDALGWAPFLGVGLLGFLAWTLTEYLLHRFIFHFRAEGPLEKRIQFIMHGMHHDDPNDPTRLVMTPTVGLVLAFVFYGGFHAVFGPVYVRPFYGFFVVGYLVYDYTHYFIHHFTPRSAWGKLLKRHHMAHHFADHDARWGVSSPLWDGVFGTLPSLPDKRGSRREPPSH